MCLEIECTSVIYSSIFSNWTLYHNWMYAILTSISTSHEFWVTDRAITNQISYLFNSSRILLISSKIAKIYAHGDERQLGRRE